MQCSTVTEYTKTDCRTPLLWDMASRQCVIGSRRFEDTVVLKRRLPSDAVSHPRKNGVVKHITAKTSDSQKFTTSTLTVCWVITYLPTLYSLQLLFIVH